MSDLLPLAVLIGGALVLLILVRSKWPGWMAAPFTMVTASAVLDCGISPLAAQYFGYSYSSRIISQVRPEEVLGAIALLLLNSGAVATGMFFAWWLWREREGNNYFPANHEYSQDVVVRAWKASVVMFLVGSLCNGYVLWTLGQDRSLFALAANRVLFGDEAAWSNSFYRYAVLFSSTMRVGAWGMLLFSRRQPLHMRLAILANVAFVLPQVLYGGRLATVMAILGAGMVLHYGVHRLSRRQTLTLGALGVVALASIRFLRFGTSSPVETLRNIAADVLVTGSVDETAFALRAFPSTIPFLGGTAILAKFNHLFQVPIFRGRSIWAFFVDYYFAGRNPSQGIGGQHYTIAAEHYMYLGYGGVILFGVFFGLFFGRLFVWQRQQPKNLFVLMFVITASIAFFSGLLDGKMAAGVGGLGFSALLPIGLLAAAACGWDRSEFALFAPLYLGALFFFLGRLFRLEVFDYAFAAALVPAYIACFRLINGAGPIKEERPSFARNQTLAQGRVPVIAVQHRSSK